MSLINDALKQARNTPPKSMPSTVPPPQPVVDKEPSHAIWWVIFCIVIALVVGAIFYIGWSTAHKTVLTESVAPVDDNSDSETGSLTVPVVTPRPVEPTPPPPPPPPQQLPKLQGIFYSPTAPTAILDGKTVHVGSKHGDYLVKAISKYTVTLTGPDKKDIQVGMGN